MFINKIISSIVVALLGFCFMSDTLYAKCPQIGGYDVFAGANMTLDALDSKKVVSEKEYAGFKKLLVCGAEDEMTMGPALGAFYDGVGAFLIERRVITKQEFDFVKNMAAISGGVKIGGYNPVVLLASFLDLLVKSHVLSQEAAQSILDGSKS